MPGYVSHTVMARDVYNRLKIKNVDFDYMITYSLGGDLCKYASCRRDSHRIRQDEFIYKMCDYIKNNSLYNDKKIMGVLYGHICHLVMDNIIHPFVYRLDDRCNYVGFKKHTLIEGYIDSYLVRYKYDIRISKYDNENLLVGDMNRNISKMIDYVYMEVYDTRMISFYYRFNLFLYRNVRLLYKIFGIKLLKKICKYDKFMCENKDRFEKLDDDIRNRDNINRDGNSDVNRFKNNELINLYDKSVDVAIKYIDKVNDYMGIS